MKVYVIVDGYDCEFIQIFATRELAEASLDDRLAANVAKLKPGTSAEHIESYRQWWLESHIEEIEVVGA